MCGTVSLNSVFYECGLLNREYRHNWHGEPSKNKLVTFSSHHSWAIGVRSVPLLQAFSQETLPFPRSPRI